MLYAELESQEKLLVKSRGLMKSSRDNTAIKGSKKGVFKEYNSNIQKKDVKIFKKRRILYMYNRILIVL